MRQMYESGAYDDEPDVALARMADLRAQRAALEGEGFTPSGWLHVPTGRTVRDRWAETVDDAERNAILRSTGIRFLVMRAAHRGQPAPDRLAVVPGTFGEWLADPLQEGAASALSTITRA
jgi:hypothetical protein